MLLILGFSRCWIEGKAPDRGRGWRSDSQGPRNQHYAWVLNEENHFLQKWADTTWANAQGPERKLETWLKAPESSAPCL